MWRMLALAACLIVTPAAAEAQSLRVERESVLAAVGEVIDDRIELSPVEPGPGLVARQAVGRPGTSTLRLHFTVPDGAADSSWHVEVAPAQGPRHTYRPDPGARDFWTQEVAGSSATVEVFTTARTAPKLVIDRIVVSRAPVKPKSIVGPDQREPYRVQTGALKTLGRSIVRLRFVDDVRKKVFTCTGFVAFTSAHVLTNEHCINTDEEMRSALADLDFDGGGAVPRSLTFARLLLADRALDFSLLELSQPSARAALTFDPAPQSDGRALAIIQHPGGEVKQVSVRDCRIKGARVSGTTDAATDFGHTCDTLGGSSGSPVLAADTSFVVGLHHFGFLPGDPDPVNQAVQISLVLDKIRSRFPALFGTPSQ